MRNCPEGHDKRVNRLLRLLVWRRRLHRLPRRRGRLAFRVLSLVETTVLLSLAPASAIATPLDLASGRTALNAYHAYFATLVASLSASERRGDAFVASVSTGCPNVLAEVGSQPPGSTSEAALTAFGQEIGFDAALAVSAPGIASFAALSKTLTRLHWSSPQAAGTIKSFVRAKRTLLALPTSDLCQDARALASSHAQSTPAGTQTFLATAARDVRRSAAGTLSFDKVLARFSTPAESRVIQSTNRLVQRLGESYSTVAVSEGFKLLPILGLAETA